MLRPLLHDLTIEGGKRRGKRKRPQALRLSGSDTLERDLFENGRVPEAFHRVENLDAGEEAVSVNT